jgi:triacylglycerol lipase
VPYRDIGRVHLGFQLGYNSIHDEVEATLQQWSGHGRTLWITGHSLGGALALIAAANLRLPIDPTKTEPRPIASLYTFGQPRVGSVGFCQACEVHFGSVYFRYINNEDIVTRIPPRKKIYDDAGSIKYIDRNQEIHEDPAPMQMFIDRILAGIELLQKLQIEKPKIGAIADHAIKDYIAAIKKKLGS